MNFLRALRVFLRGSFNAFVCACVLFLFITLLAGAVTKYRTVYPTPETESSFLRSYLPADVIEHFDEHWGSGRGDGIGAGAGQGYATHTRSISFQFATKSESVPLISKALRESALQALRGYRMQVLGEAEDTNGDYCIRYAQGNTEGSVTVKHVIPNETIHRRKPLDSRLEDVTAEIRIDEKWTKR